MDLMKCEIYCTYTKSKVLVNECMECNNFSECDYNWCDNHRCTNCENKQYGFCKGDGIDVC